MRHGLVVPVTLSLLVCHVDDVRARCVRCVTKVLGDETVEVLIVDVQVAITVIVEDRHAVKAVGVTDDWCVVDVPDTNFHCLGRTETVAVCDSQLQAVTAELVLKCVNLQRLTSQCVVIRSWVTVRVGWCISYCPYERL